MSRGSSRGFTLVEALVAVALLAIGVVSTMSALGSMVRTEVGVRERERMLTLATAKLNELLATGDAQNALASGDFQDYEEDRYSWSADVQPTGIENLNALTVTVERLNDRDRSTTVEALMFTAPETGTGEEGQ
ncbi:MAG TPA: prepilin-type N-terminal cleavage/methylation domain-containing protein [Fimbriimonas sp.]